MLAPTATRDEGNLSKITEPFRYNLIKWETSHFFDKWVYAYRFRNNEGESVLANKNTYLTDFSELSRNIKVLENELSSLLSSVDQANTKELTSIRNELVGLKLSQSYLEPYVERIYEQTINEALVDLGVIDQIGPFNWPPVDFAFEKGALLLVMSPKNKIERLDDVLLKPNIELLSQIQIENAVESSDPNLSALIIRIGGLATYPSQVSPYLSPLNTLEMIAHEWAHHWLFFRPLGKKWWAGGDIRTINETVAGIVGSEVSAQANSKLEIKSVTSSQTQPSKIDFDFRGFMLDTRLKLEDLLDKGLVKESEDWLEKRRTKLLDHGIEIRKLNTAYFAFYGSYAADPRSGEKSPLLEQIEKVRSNSSDLANFLEVISQVTTAEELEKLAENK